jgi:hypothetical protein
MKARYLVDKSALARMSLEPVRERLAPIYDSDYEIIARTTKQPVEWVVKRGSVD